MNLPLLLAATGVSFPGIGLNNIPINRVAFTIGSFPVYWYGICIILAFGLCIGLAMWQAPKFGIKPDDVIDVSIVVIPAAVIGARIYYVASAWSEFASDPISVFNIRNGGLAVLGGVLFSILAVFILTKIKKKSVQEIFDFLIVYIPLGQAIGRWGNFFNSEAFGGPTDLPWKLYIPPNSRPIGYANFEYFHPTFLYESLWNLTVFGLLLTLFFRDLQGKIRLKTGALFLVYLAAYSSGRVWIEGLRTDSLMFGPLRAAQMVSLTGIVLGLGGLAWLYLLDRPLPDVVSPNSDRANIDRKSPGDR